MDELPTPRMLANKLRPLASAQDGACIKGTPMVPLHIATVTTLWNVLESVALEQERAGA